MLTKGSFTQIGFINVLVGPERTKFHLHKDLIYPRSPFFAKFLQANAFKEGEERQVKLEEEDPEAFEQLVNWTYTDSFAVV